MLAPSALIELWEHGAACGALERGLLLLGAARPEIDSAALADVAVSTRDACVFELRTALFGARYCGVVDCPQCAARLEFSCDADTLRRAREAVESALTACDGSIALRLPTSRDLSFALHASDDEEHGARCLVERCCTPLDGRWDEARYRAAEAALDVEIGRADMQFAMQCADCGSAWQTTFDICAWLWSELERHACALLDEVHRLAGYYGWSEREILALHPARRAAYLARCDA
jgi:hypothetical protein